MVVATDTPQEPIIVWTKPNCVQCDATKKLILKKGLEYIEKDLTVDLTALEDFRAQGFASAPIVQAQGRTWSGFRPDKIKELIA